MSTQIQLKELLLPIILQDMMGTLGDIKEGQTDSKEVIKKLANAIEKVDLTTYLKYDVLDAASIRRRIKRVEFLTGSSWHRGGISEGFSNSLKNIIQTSYEEVYKSDMYKNRYNVSIWDLMTFFPQVRLEGVKIMKEIEKEYDIPKAIYTINQVKKLQ